MSRNPCAPLELLYNHTVSDPTAPRSQVIVTPVISALRSQPQADVAAPTKCERCGAEMYRMHAVWRCTQCRFKTDCCGW
jgi:hypothetical protein